MKNTLFTCFFLATSIPVLWSQSNPLDLSFGTNGSTTLYSSTSAGPNGSKMAIQHDGKILMAGFTFDPLNGDFIMARFTVDGQLDNSFNGTGKVYTDFGNTDDLPTTLVVQADDKILVGGYAVAGPWGDFALARYNPDGQLDSSFSTDGLVKTPIGTSDDRAYAMVVQPDNKILMAGYTKQDNNKSIALVRYNPDGSLDVTFNGTGKVVTSVGTGGFGAQSLVLQADGKILVAGGEYDFMVTRYNTDGSLDNNFGTAGTIITPVGNGNDHVDNMALQTDGKILVIGTTETVGTGYDFAIVRYNPDGSLDHTFNNSGKVVTAVSNGQDNAYAVVIQPYGQILVAGSSNGQFTLVKYNTNGSLDETFGNDGITTTAIGNFAGAYSLGFQPNGKVILGGYARIGSYFYFAIARYTSNVEVGLIEFSKQQLLTLAYPNPVYSDLILEYELRRATTLTIDLFNLNGQLVQRLNPGVEHIAGNYLEHYTIADHLAAGQYIICFSDGYSKWNIKIFKQ